MLPVSLPTTIPPSKSSCGRIPACGALSLRKPVCCCHSKPGPSLCLPAPHRRRQTRRTGCVSLALWGASNADKGGHLVCWDYDLIIRFPPLAAASHPVGRVTHSNTPIQDGEERFSIIQYTAGGPFPLGRQRLPIRPLVACFCSAEDLARREEERKARCADALKKFPLWKDVKVRNF
ncbi:hypothetical protein B0H14DRAFT_2346471 [Mycena olivaceomarginata]|nr:hypothetical protein B0H14DRAFT_2346471 [Mycena olivaceomarginata]